MKKNTMMRLASALLVLVLLTTCAISGTFAKYTSTAAGEDIARVAYWGWNAPATITIDELFEEVYIDKEVQSAGAMDTTVTDIIAPGTTNSATFAFAYTNYQTNEITAPEVAYTFDVDASASTCAADIQNNPNILWALDADADTDYGTWTDLMDAIEALDDNVDNTSTYGPGQLPEAFKPGTTHTISWKWIFETKVDGEVDADQDEMDTAMGNKTGAEGDLLDQVKIVITVTATQINELAALPVAP